MLLMPACRATQTYHHHHGAPYHRVAYAFDVATLRFVVVAVRAIDAARCAPAPSRDAYVLMLRIRARQEDRESASSLSTCALPRHDASLPLPDDVTYS